jgi:hypothetical protein
MSEPETDRWAHLRDTCPHGIIRSLLTCPACEPEKQAAAEAHARAAVDRRDGNVPVVRADESGSRRPSETPMGFEGWSEYAYMDSEEHP